MKFVLEWLENIVGKGFPFFHNVFEEFLFYARENQGSFTEGFNTNKSREILFSFQYNFRRESQNYGVLTYKPNRMDGDRSVSKFNVMTLVRIGALVSLRYTVPLCRYAKEGHTFSDHLAVSLCGLILRYEPISEVRFLSGTGTYRCGYGHPLVSSESWSSSGPVLIKLIFVLS